MKIIKYVLLLFLLLTACSNETDQVMYPSNDLPELKQVLNSNEAVYGFKGIVDKDDVLVSIDIRRMNQFKENKIAKKITKQLEEKYPDKEFLVTNDLKLKWEIEKIMKQELKTEELTKSVEKIKSLLKEET
ncbi:hypothetical protein [Psychrobacillus soli]|uniref:Sporulation protein n=1 Tax=Psychrobacillus soli TaxID=1543965 RepID=A0A544T2J7_9BACI|nr:hypothetical protein [Psychrobacillus soli]TQR11686.1 hypothetical protein FG383_13830 [Psychrobacillus soli]